MKFFRLIKKNVLYSFLLLCIFMLAAFHTNAQRYPFYNLTTENGLPSLEAHCLAQDVSGNLWIGTSAGLARYDGKNTTAYTIKNGLLNNNITALAAANNGHIWIGSPNSVTDYDGRNFSNYTFNAANNAVNEVSEIKIINDSVWCRAGGHIYVIHNKKISYLQTPGADAYITAMLPGQSNVVWIAKGGSIYHYNNKKWDTLELAINPATNKYPYVYSIFKDKAQHIWLATNSGLFTVVNKKIFIAQNNKQPLNNLPPLYSLAQDNNGAFWMGTSTGVIRLSADGLQYYNSHNGLSDNAVYNLLADAEGNIWIATEGQGVFRFSGTQFTALDESVGLAATQVTSITADKSGRLFLGTSDANMYIFQDGQLSKLEFPSKPTPYVTAMAYTRDGKVWIGTRSDGLWRYDKFLLNYKYPTHHFPENNITALYAENNGRLWIGFPNGALLHVHDSFKRVQIRGAYVNAFAGIGNDSMLIATKTGLLLHADSTTTSFKTGTALDSAIAECMAVNGNELWIGTNRGVIGYNLTTHKSITINKNNGLQSDIIYSTVADNSGNIWVGTPEGIHRISLKENEAPVVTYFGKGQALAGTADKPNAIYKMPDGSLWFGTVNSALHYQGNTRVTVAKPTSLVMESIHLFGKSLADTTYYDSTDNWRNVPYNLHLPYKQNNLTFTFRAISLSGDQQVLYRYRIDELDEVWSAWTGVNTASYSLLPPGNYTLHVQSTADGGQNVKDLVYKFEIITPFQQTLWFKLAVLAACILLGILIQYIIDAEKQKTANQKAGIIKQQQTEIALSTAKNFNKEIKSRLANINAEAITYKNATNSTIADQLSKRIENGTVNLQNAVNDYLWLQRPGNDALAEVLNRIKETGDTIFQANNIEFIFSSEEEKYIGYTLPLDIAWNMTLIFKEAFQNTASFSEATQAQMEIIFKRRDALQIIFKDNGKGFDVKSALRRHGIYKMKEYADKINARLYIDSNNKGSIVSFTCKIPAKTKA